MKLRVPTRLQPITHADPTELIPALRACHMIASFILLDADRTLWAFLADLIDLSRGCSFGRSCLRTRHAVVVLDARLTVVPGRVVS